MGLLMAAELRRHGVTCRLVEKRAARSKRSKALAVQLRSLELFEDIGIVGEFLAVGRKIHAMNMISAGERVAHIELGEADAPYPYVLILPQSDTERLLEAHLEGLGGAVERERALEGMVDDSDSGCVRATFDGGERVIEAQYLIGCDGAHSRVREAAEIAYQGEDLGQTFCFIDAPLTCDLDRDEAHIFLSERGPTLFFPLPNGQDWRIILAAGDHEPDALLERFEAEVQSRTGASLEFGDRLWQTQFTVRQRQAAQHRKGRVFLCGDAAHCHSPIGGQGMNTGLQDAYNLAWKLGLVLRGQSPASLLDSYADEREPVAQKLLSNTARATRALTLRRAVPRALLTSAISLVARFDAVQGRIAAVTGELNIHYRHSAITCEVRTALLDTTMAFDGTETPTVADWRAFGAAPQAGDRAIDGWLANGLRLYELVAGTQHTLLLFDGATTGDGYDNLGQIARAVTERYGHVIQVCVVLAGTDQPEALDWDGLVVSDGDRELHQRYGAGSECLYVIRPDNYVGYRSQPADQAALFDWLASQFT